MRNSRSEYAANEALRQRLAADRERRELLRAHKRALQRARDRDDDETIRAMTIGLGAIAVFMLGVYVLARFFA